jgi:hypothetical protein
MKKVTYANGDSFVFGMSCLGDDDRTQENKELAFPKYLADLLKSDKCINNSYCGATNEFTFKNTIFDLQELEKSGVSPNDVFVIIGITSLHRIEIDAINWWESLAPYGSKLEFSETQIHSFTPEFKKYGTLFVNPSAQLTMHSPNGSQTVQEAVYPWAVTFLWTERIQLESQEARIIALHEYLKSKGYAHIFVNTVCPLERTKYIDLTCKNFYNLDTASFRQFGWDDYPTELRNCGHFSAVPHEKYAQKLFEYIQQNKIVL